MVLQYKGKSVKKINIEIPNINIEGLFDEYESEGLLTTKLFENDNSCLEEFNLNEFLAKEEQPPLSTNYEAPDENKWKEFAQEFLKSTGAIILTGLSDKLIYFFSEYIEKIKKQINEELQVITSEAPQVYSIEEIIGNQISIKTIKGEDLSISLEELNKILKDSDLYKKFRFYENNQEEFGGFNQLEIANAMKIYLETIEKYNIQSDLTSSEMNRMKKIVDWYAIDNSELQFILNAYKTYYEPKLWTDQAKDLIFDNVYQMVMDSKYEQLLKYIEDSEYKTAIQDMRGYALMMEYSIIRDGVDIGEENFQKLANNILSRNYIVSQETDLAYLSKFINEYGYNLDEATLEKYNQLSKLPELEEWKSEIVSMFYDFAGAYVSKEKIDTIYGSFIYKLNENFKEELTSSELAAAYNNGVNSTMNLVYDPYVIKSYMTHESMHQVSSGFKGYDENNIYNSYTGINQYTYNSTTETEIEIAAGLNESITEYFNQLIMGNYYPEGNCGYEEAVDKLIILIDKGLFNLEDLKQAYFNNDISILTYKLDQISLNNDIPKLTEKLLLAFDQAISGEYEVRQEGLQKLNEIIKEISLINSNEMIF